MAVPVITWSRVGGIHRYDYNSEELKDLSGAKYMARYIFGIRDELVQLREAASTAQELVPLRRYESFLTRLMVILLGIDEDKIDRYKAIEYIKKADTTRIKPWVAIHCTIVAFLTEHAFLDEKWIRRGVHGQTLCDCGKGENHNRFLFGEPDPDVIDEFNNYNTREKELLLVYQQKQKEAVALVKEKGAREQLKWDARQREAREAVGRQARKRSSSTTPTSHSSRSLQYTLGRGYMPRKNRKNSSQ